MRGGEGRGRGKGREGGRLRVLREIININSDIITTETHKPVTFRPRNPAYLSICLSVLPIDRSIAQRQNHRKGIPTSGNSDANTPPPPPPPPPSHPSPPTPRPTPGSVTSSTSTASFPQSSPGTTQKRRKKERARSAVRKRINAP